MANRTEEGHAQAQDLDTREPVAILKLLAEGQQAAARAVDAAIEPLARAASLATEALGSGGRLVYAGAGSSGLMAMVDALELPGTYGLAQPSVVVLLAGGTASLADLTGGYEDDRDLGVRDTEQAGVGAGDCILIVSASGGTPYALGCAQAAREGGATIVAIANNPGARLFEMADVAVLLETPPEVISGSTRLGAGTAQKIALNMISTLVGIGLGHVHDGHMVNLRPDNAKLRQRATRMVAAIASVDPLEAVRHLEVAGGSVKLAVLLASGVPDRATAQQRLDRAGQSLRRALALGDTEERR
ncbi:N-acetylmuramic acid 6-phosphate etherase [Rhizobium sp. Leaf371]|uniref:N-acetylmuramic acid 6-phosphate etherase n=1 Tax=Rhizobium sp. Leaf371 TaxID=1736355 RepID=UPI0007136AFE|nr:N-acetylmuramic acid 6-phosphate etherase [Rhizobium sp. Leaf371]KQS65590.1 N-acetylmuramic acid 6-phosphate etherase [Rhizobium sp. Leaf371]